MKFTFEGSVKIKAHLLPINDKEAVEISVVDTGFGIKEEDQENLFKLWGTLESTKLLNKSGTGIGLY
jgi:signal transduction histidine kinase